MPEKPFNNYERLCMVTLVVLGNYLALIGLRYSKKAAELLCAGKLADATHAARVARAWGLYGLIPTTVLNVAIIYYLCLFIWHIYSEQVLPMLRGLF